MKQDIKQFLKPNENASITQQNPWNMMKVVLRGEFIAISVHIIKNKGAQMNSLIAILSILKMLAVQNQT